MHLLPALWKFPDSDLADITTSDHPQPARCHYGPGNGSTSENRVIKTLQGFIDPFIHKETKRTEPSLNLSATRPYFEYKHQQVTSRRRDFTSNPIYIVWSAPETKSLNFCRGNLGTVSQADQLAFVGQASSASPGAVTLTLAGYLGHSWSAPVIPHTGTHSNSLTGGEEL